MYIVYETQPAGLSNHRFSVLPMVNVVIAFEIAMNAIFIIHVILLSSSQRARRNVVLDW